jgi:plastocyanin
MSAVAAGVIALSAGSVPVALANGGVQEVQVRDECDPATFDQALGPGACDPRFGGDVTFGQLVSKLSTDATDVLAERKALGWRFNPDTTTVKGGDSLSVRSRGGETHTFTEVPAFGGGCVQLVNDLLGLSMNPICSVDGNGDGQPDWLTTAIAPGQTTTIPPLTAKTHYYQCLIHPWMRTTVTAR